MRRYKSVPEGTLLACMEAWEALSYELQYRAKQKAGFDPASADKDMELVGSLSIDLQDVYSELIARGIAITYDTIRQKYSRTKTRSKPAGRKRG